MQQQGQGEEDTRALCPYQAETAGSCRRSPRLPPVSCLSIEGVWVAAGSSCPKRTRGQGAPRILLDSLSFARSLACSLLLQAELA